MSTPGPTALIAEDEPLLAQALQAELTHVWPTLQVVATVVDGSSAVQQALALRPQVLFLDIRMPGLSGLEAAAELADAWPLTAGPRFPVIVFVTAYDEYAVQAFEAQASDYLLKPVQPDRLRRCVEKVQRALMQPAADAIEMEATLQRLRTLLGAALPASASRLRHLPVGVGSSVRLVALEDVVYLEAADKYVRVLTEGHEYLIRTPLRELLPQLDPDAFWQVHRGTVVRLGAVVQAMRDESGRVWLQLRGRPEKLAVSRVYAPRFKAL